MNIDIKSIVKTISRKQRGLEDPRLVYPMRDWVIGVIGSLVIIFGTLLFSIFDYKSYTNLSPDDEIILAMIPYHTDQVEEAITKYQVRAKAYADTIMLVGSSTKQSLEADLLIEKEGVNKIETDTRYENQSPAIPASQNVSTTTEDTTITSPALAV